MNFWQTISKVLLRSALHKRKSVTLDIDVSEVLANKTSAKGIYKSNIPIDVGKLTKQPSWSPVTFARAMNHLAAGIWN